MNTTMKGAATARVALRLTTLALVATTAACVTKVTPGRLAPVSARMSDDVIARDLATFDSVSQRLQAVGEPSGTERRYLATRAKEYLSLAKEAYERNDPSGFADDALAWAKADIETLERDPGQGALSAVPMEARGSTNSEMWARADALRRDVSTQGNPEAIAQAEGRLVRASHPFLAGPACTDEPSVAVAARMLDAADKGKAAMNKPVAPPVAPNANDDRANDAANRPNANDANKPAPKRDCSAPEKLMGVPTIVHFALDKSYLAASTKAVLDTLVERLRPYPGIHVVIGGHTDPRASDEYNQALSERRTRSVLTYLLSRGMKREQIEDNSYGEKRLMLPGTSIQDHARNRRVELAYTLCDGSFIVPVEQLNDLQLEAAKRRQAYKEK